jgi:hypothetical protein
MRTKSEDWEEKLLHTIENVPQRDKYRKTRNICKQALKEQRKQIIKKIEKIELNISFGSGSGHIMKGIIIDLIKDIK